MTVLLLLATVLVFLAAERYLRHRRERIAEVARARGTVSVAESQSYAGPPTDLFFHPGHTWVRVHDDKLASIGATDFASNFAGDISSVELPAEGARLHQAAPAWTLVSTGRRRLTQAMPIDGKVLAVNRELLENPGLAQRAPYQAGWILRVRPRDLAQSIRNLLPAAAAPLWMDAARARVVTRLSPALGAVALDGGEWVSGFGDRLTDEDWETLKHELFPGTPRSGDRPSAERRRAR